MCVCVATDSAATRVVMEEDAVPLTDSGGQCCSGLCVQAEDRKQKLSSSLICASGEKSGISQDSENLNEMRSFQVLLKLDDI